MLRDLSCEDVDFLFHPLHPLSRFDDGTLDESKLAAKPIDLRIHTIEPRIHAVEPRIHTIEPRVDRVESILHLLTKIACFFEHLCDELGEPIDVHRVTLTRHSGMSEPRRFHPMPLALRVARGTPGSMTTNREFYERAHQHFLRNYRQPPFIMARGQGLRVWDVEGNEFLDFSGGIAVLSVGHSHPVLVKAIAEQASRLIHTSNLFFSDRTIELAAEITHRTGFDRVYFANSGTEANEALLKLARRFHYERGDKQRTELVATHNSFHGRTMGAVTLTGQPKYHEGFGPMLPDVLHIPYGDLEALRNVVGKRTAAVFLEPIQAEGGLIVGTDEYLRGARAMCDEAGALLMFDEVQTGYGRTGRFLAREWSGVMPDACSLAKGIAGGFPLAAMVLTEKLAQGLPVGAHGSTFGGNPIAAAAGLAVLRIFDEENLVANCETMGRYLGAQLALLVSDRALPAAIEVRGKGLLQGVRIDPTYDALGTLAVLRDNQRMLASIAGGDVLRLAPPLNVTRPDIDDAIVRLRTALGQAPKK